MKRRELGAIISWNILLGSALSAALVLDLFGALPYSAEVFISLSFLGVLPVVWSALRALFKKELTVDLLASIALLFSFLAHEWR